MDRKELKRRYDELLADIETAEMFDGRKSGVDVYTCDDCGFQFYTRYKDKGVTPFTVRCHNCTHGRATHDDTISPSNAAFLGVKIHEWVRPTFEQLLKLDKGIIEHVLNGGLVLDEELKTFNPMKREYKFRGKCKQTGEWVYGDLEHRRINGRTFIHTYKEDGSYDCNIEVIPETVAQFTGLKDKKGNEIYDGHILNVKFSDGSGCENLVGWDEKHACFGCMDKYAYQSIAEGFDYAKFDGDLLKTYLENAVTFVVIGNIHDNPEFLSNNAQEENSILSMRISDCDLSVRALCCLKNAGISTVGELIKCNKYYLLKYRNFGKKSLAEIEDFLESNGLNWSMENRK